MEFSYFLPVHIQFGWDKVDSVADFVIIATPINI